MIKITIVITPKNAPTIVSIEISLVKDSDLGISDFNWFDIVGATSSGLQSFDVGSEYLGTMQTV